MIKSYRVAAAALTAAIALTACGGGGSSVTPNSGATLPTVTPPAYTGPQSLAKFTYGANALQGAQYVGPANVGTLGVDVSLQLQNASGLQQYAKEVNDPHSGLYRHFLTPQQIGQQFGASTANVTAAANYFGSYKLHVGTWPQHLSLFVAGSQHALEQAFGTKFGVYRQGSSTFIAPSTAPHFSKTLPVVGVTRLVTAQRSFTNHMSLGGGGSLTTSGYTPQQIRNAFDYTGAYKAGFNGSGINVGIVGTGPISPADVPAYGSMFNTNVATVTQMNATDQGVAAANISNTVGYPTTGLTTPPPATAHDCASNVDAPGGSISADCNPEDVEAQLDTEMVASLAPGSNVLFYLAYSASNCVDPSTGNITAPPCSGSQVVFPLIGINLADDEIQQAISDNKVDILSLSYGGPEITQSSYEFDPTTLQGMGPSEFAALASEGIAVFVSSGDAGAEGCQRPAFQPDINQACVSYPASDPSVVSVGGVTAPLDQFGNLTNQIIGWGLTTNSGSGGSGGGISSYFPQPQWQAGIPGVQGSTRNQPDVSLLGDNRTGAAVVINAAFSEQVGTVGGTSVAAPQMAAMWALVLQACKQSATCATASGTKPYRLGNPAQILYGLYAKPKTNTILPTYTQAFYDVLYGNNQQVSVQPSPGASPLDPGYDAGPGYDLVTGLGVPFARALIKAVTNQ